MKRLLALVFVLILAVMACERVPAPIPSATKETAQVATKTHTPRVTRQSTPQATPPPGAAARPSVAPTPSPGSLFAVGQQVQAGAWLFTTVDVQYHKVLKTKDSSVTAAGVYCVVFLDVYNRASDTKFFDELRWRLLDSRGNLYNADVTTFIAASQFEVDGTPWDNIGPGQKARIVIAFDLLPIDLPSGALRLLLLYSQALQRPFVWLGYAPQE